MGRRQVLLLSGSTRNGSTNTAALHTLHQLADASMSTVLCDQLAKLPAFNPDQDRDPLDPAVANLRQRIATADAVLICTPEYAGTLPGAFKNLLDWTVGGGEMYGKPAAWINVAAPGRGQGAHATLATVLGYLDADIIKPACRSIPVPRDVVGSDGLIIDRRIRNELAQVLHAIGTHLDTSRPS